MNRTVTSVFILAALLAGAACAQETGEHSPAGKAGLVQKNRAPVAKNVLQVRFPRPKTATLPNGVRVFVLEDHRLPTVRFSLMMKAGTLFEPKPGLADITASMLSEGTKSRTADQLARDTESIGADLSADAAMETTTVGISGLAENAPKLVEILADMALNPSFPEDRFAREKFRTAARLTQRRSDPTAMASEVSGRVLYGDTPYAGAFPTPEQVTALTRADLAAFHDRFFRPNGALLGVAGDVRTKDVVALLTKAFADWKPGASEPTAPSAEFSPKPKTRVYLLDRPGSVQTVLRFANIGIRRTDPDYIPLTVADHILGGGFMSRLFENIRERHGYSYGPGTALVTARWPGQWLAGASVRTPVTGPAVHEFMYEFRRLQTENVSEADLDRAKRSLIGSFALSLEIPQRSGRFGAPGILDRALELVRYGLPADYWDTYPAKVRAVTPADIQRVSQKYLGEGKIQVIAVGEREQIEAALKEYGPVQVLESAEQASHLPNP